jgi:hypothetical protein
MVKVTLLLVFALVLFVSISAIEDSSKAMAGPLQSGAAEGKGCSAPKQWGQLKGVADRAVAFEDDAGNIRILDLGPCMRGETRLIVQINRP